MAEAVDQPVSAPRGFGLLALYLMLGFCAGLPFYMFNATLLYRLQQHNIDIQIVGYFAWVALLQTFKFAWAPLLDRYDVPGFGRFWGKRRGWLMLSQLGIATSLAGMAFTSSDSSLALTALFATLLALWTSTFEVAADAWRIELAPTAETQGPIVAANLWGYRTAMVGGSAGAIYLSSLGNGDSWTLAYLVIAAAAFVPFPILAAMRGERGGIERIPALVAGLGTSVGAIAALAVAVAAVGWLVLRGAVAAGMSSTTNLTIPVVLVAMAPFLIMAAMVPRIVKLPASTFADSAGAPTRPYVNFFWRYGYLALPLLLFVSLYRMGDVMALTLSHPMFGALGYGKTDISIADSWITVPASMAGVALGGWLAAKRPAAQALVIGAVVSAISNWAFAWLAWRHPGGETLFTLFGWPITRGGFDLYLSMALDQFGHGFAGAVFVVYLSMITNPRFPGAHYAFLSGFAFLLPRLIAGASGAMQKVMGWDGFFLMTGALSLASVALLPIVVRARARSEG